MITRMTDAIAINGRRAREDRPPEADRVAALEPPRPPEPAAAVVAALRPVVGSVRAEAVSEAALVFVAAPDLKLVAASDVLVAPLDRELVSAWDPMLDASLDLMLVRAVESLVPAADWVTQDGLPPAAERLPVREVSWVDTPSREWESAM